MKRFAIGAASLCLGMAASAQGLQDWVDARLETAITVSRTSDPGLFKVTAVLQDAATGKVLAQPKKPLVTKAGVNAVTEMGIDGGPRGSYMYRLDLTVQADGSSARFRSQFMKDGQVTGATRGLLMVQPDENPVAVSTAK